MNSENHHASLMEHLRDLRVCLIRSVIAILIGATACYAFSEEIFDILRKPIAPFLPGGGLVYTAPTDKFMAHLKVSIFAGIIISAPFWFFQIWRFVAPGLHKDEKRMATGFVSASTFLFLAGTVFCYFLILPVACEFLMTYGGTVDKPMITIDQYLSFVVWTIVAFGAAFELPVILVILGMLGLVTHEMLSKNRRIAVVILAVSSAVLTPGSDLISMGAMLVPMMLLYEVSIFLVKRIGQKQIAETP